MRCITIAPMKTSLLTTLILFTSILAFAVTNPGTSKLIGHWHNVNGNRRACVKTPPQGERSTPCGNLPPPRMRHPKFQSTNHGVYINY